MHPRKKDSFLDEFFDTIDLFNDPIRFRLNGKRAINTTLGGVLTIAIVIFIISQIGAEFVKMFNYDDPQVYEISELEDNPEKVHFNQQNGFFIAIVIFVNSNPINMSKVSVLNFQTTFNKHTKLENGTTLKTKYPVYWAPCNESDFSEELYGPNVYTTNSLEYGYCTTGINFTNSSDGTCPEYILKQYPNCISPLDFEIQGTYKSEQFDYFQCIGVACDPNDPTLPYGMVCDTEANVNLSLSTKEIKKNIYYPYSLINSANYLKPNITFIDNVYWNLHPSILKLSDIFVDRVTIQDFDSWIFDKSYKNRSFFSIPSDKMRELEESQAATSTKLIEWNLRRSSLNTVVSRTYIKITGILTELGGFTKALIFIAAMISIGFIKFRYNMLIANELYDFKFPQSSSQPIEKPSPSDRKGMMLSIDYSDNKGLVHAHDHPSFSSPRADFIPNKPIRDYAEKLNMRKRRLDHSEWGYLKMIFTLLCCKRKPEEEISRKARELAYKDIDIIKLVLKIKEIERLKFLVLNPDQRDAFGFMEKPLITMNNKKPIHLDSLTAPSRSASKKHSARSRNHSHTQTKEVSIISDAMPVNEPIEPDMTNLSKYGRLYVAYRYLIDDPDPKNAVLNKKLLGMLGQDLLKVFRRVDQLSEDEPDPRQFEEIIKQVLETPTDLVR